MMHNDSLEQGEFSLEEVNPSVVQESIEKESRFFNPDPERYLFLGEHGKGGMKAIISVKDAATRRKVAMAVLTEKLVKDDENRIRFLQEAHITARLEHPNIVPIHDIGVNADGSPFFTMKMLSGESLSQVLKKLRKDETGYRKKYTLHALLLILLKVMDAVAFAHSKGFIHLDLKPDNIQIGEYGEVSVLDWGLAKQLQKHQVKEEDLNTVETYVSSFGRSDVQLTLDGEVKGTIGYMAPEQARGHNTYKDTRADIYALGAILYSLLCWYRPIKGRPDVTEQFMQALKNTVEGKVIDIYSQNDQVVIPSPLVAVVRRSMAVNPKERYQTVEAFSQEILKYLNGFATEAERATRMRQFLLWMNRHKLITYIVLSIIILISSLGFFSFEVKRRLEARWGREQQILPTKYTQVVEQWIQKEGNWNIETHSITSMVKGAHASRIQYIQPIYGNIAVEFDAKVNTIEDLKEGGDLSLILNYDPEAKEDGYFFQLGGFSNTVASIQRRNGFICMTPFVLEAKRTYKIRVEKESSQLRLFCDGVLLLEMEDIFYLEGGYLGLYSFGAGKVFSNIKLFERGIPEWTNALTEGDAFYRRSRAVQSPETKRELLLFSWKAFSSVWKNHSQSQLGLDALTRRAYVSLEMGDYGAAETDLSTLQSFDPHVNISQLLLGGEIKLRTGNFQSAHDYFTKALQLFPHLAGQITGILMARLSDEKIFDKSSDIYKQYFWQLAAEYQKTAVFRARTKALGSLEFLRARNFEMLDVSNNQVKDLSPLSHMKLKHFNCSKNPILSLLPLEKMPLEELDASYTLIDNLEPLLLMPLRVLRLDGCSNLKNISPIYGLKHLEDLTLPKHISTKEKEQIYRALPKLKNKL